MEGIAPGTSKFKKKILARGSRAGGLLLLDGQAGIRAVLLCSGKGLGALELS